MANILKKRSSYALGLSRTGVTAHPPAESNSSSNFQLFRKKMLIPAPPWMRMFRRVRQELGVRMFDFFAFA